MTDQPRGEKGEFASAVSYDDILAVFEEIAPRQVTTRDVADKLNCTRETARRKLNILYERDEVGKGKTSGGIVLYWLAKRRKE